MSPGAPRLSTLVLPPLVLVPHPLVSGSVPDLWCLDVFRRRRYLSKLIVHVLDRYVCNHYLLRYSSRRCDWYGVLVHLSG